MPKYLEQAKKRSNFSAWISCEVWPFFLSQSPTSFVGYFLYQWGNDSFRKISRFCLGIESGGVKLRGDWK